MVPKALNWSELYAFCKIKTGMSSLKWQFLGLLLPILPWTSWNMGKIFFLRIIDSLVS